MHEPLILIAVLQSTGIQTRTDSKNGQEIVRCDLYELSITYLSMSYDVNDDYTE